MSNPGQSLHSALRSLARQSGGSASGHRPSDPFGQGLGWASQAFQVDRANLPNSGFAELLQQLGQQAAASPPATGGAAGGEHADNGDSGGDSSGDGLAALRD